MHLGSLNTIQCKSQHQLDNALHLCALLLFLMVIM